MQYSKQSFKALSLIYIAIPIYKSEFDCEKQKKHPQGVG